ncbi:PREDICTED: putative 57 kDa heat shock protein [Camelina sativa]|uniref:57 kDa heat shock protein n=1 Tax=Camelina sativa TaxID=90675 RepID=A0ABM1QMR0_CAMSA|nr:PREDICTED: putative 57 kDa heat shock protein [Camelina sativa]
MPILYMLPMPQSLQKGYYASNNPYQASGPKGFIEFKYLKETPDLYVKLDFPGVKEDTVLVRLVPSEKTVVVTGDAPKESPHDSSHRKYGTATGLICDCCVISKFQAFVENGVVRLILTKKKTDLHGFAFCTFRGAKMPTDIHSLASISRDYNPEDADGHPSGADHRRGLDPEGSGGTDPLDPAHAGWNILPHPSVLGGSKSTVEPKQLPNGGLFIRIDMPGVPANSVAVVIDGDSVVTVIGRAPATMHDSCGRNYLGKVALVPRGYDGRRIEINAKLGVVRLVIPP